ncbi:MAG: YceI family protein [Patescibacteria group bacterium]
MNYKNILLALAALAILAGGTGYYLLTRPTKTASQTVAPTPNAAGTSETTKLPGFNIVSLSSRANFSIYELLNGKDKTVIGTTNQITGAVDMDRNDLSSATFSDFRINARTFQTDSSQRDNAIRRMILKTEDDANEFIVFKPTGVTGTPAKAEIGQEFAFAIKGNLTISGVTKEVTFTGKSKFTNDTTFSGSVQTMVKRSDFNLIVPNLSFLANVSDDVTITFDFIASK